MRMTVRTVVFCALTLFLPRLSVAQEPFDGDWLTTFNCPAKGKTEAYTWQFPSVIQNSNFRGMHGAEGQPGYLRVEGNIAADGSAKLAVSGIAASQKYPQGEPYRYEINAQFRAAEGSGAKNEFLGAIRHPCALETWKLQPMAAQR